MWLCALVWSCVANARFPLYRAVFNCETGYMWLGKYVNANAYLSAFLRVKASPTSHFQPGYLSRCGDRFAGVFHVLFHVEAALWDRALSSTQQMVLCGVESVYNGNRGQKVLLVEQFPSMQAKHSHICCTHVNMWIVPILFIAYLSHISQLDQTSIEN